MSKRTSGSKGTSARDARSTPERYEASRQVVQEMRGNVLEPADRRIHARGVEDGAPGAVDRSRHEARESLHPLRVVDGRVGDDVDERRPSATQPDDLARLVGHAPDERFDGRV